MRVVNSEIEFSKKDIDKILDRRSLYVERLSRSDVPEDLRDMMHVYFEKTQDKVTGLQPRWALDETLDDLRRKRIAHAVAAVDLRNLGGLNTEFGHEKTNEILRDVINGHMQISVRSWGGEVYRSGGDEFHVVVPNLSENELSIKMKVIQEEIEKEVILKRNLESIPHKSQNGMPTGAGNIDYGCSDSRILDRSGMLQIADDKLAESKKRYLDIVRIKEIDNNRLWEYNPKTKKYELSVDLSKELKNEHGYSFSKNEGPGTGRYDSKGISGLRGKDRESGLDRGSEGVGRDGRGIRNEESRILKEERSAAEEKNSRVIVENLVKYACSKHISVPEKTQERWQKLLDHGESDINIRNYIDNYSQSIKGPDLEKRAPEEKLTEKPKEKEIGMDI